MKTRGSPKRARAVEVEADGLGHVDDELARERLRLLRTLTRPNRQLLDDA